MRIMSTKTYVHATGLSCVFRQWRAESHCRFLHGYALEIKITFECAKPDKNGWCQDFGGLKPIKKWLEDNFDHKTVVAESDPKMPSFKALHDLGVIDMVTVPEVGCENFARMIFNYVDIYVREASNNRVNVYEVEVREHEGNSAIARRD